ncbi:MAG: exopolyphosphatase, partial [Myxococcota bacterium]|nr:exopolyphosphatase [Myxococcota bacterium]
ILGISTRRMEVLPGGLSILLGLFDILRIKELKPHPSALREGVLNELVGRIIGADIRDQSVEAMSTRMSVDKAQALRVENFAMKLFDQAAEDWGLEESDRTLLSWAARLHEVGRSIAFSGYHNHGGYILHNADMAGFSRFDQSRLAVLVKFHRGKIRFDEMRSLCPSLEKSHHNILLLLRLATRLHRRRSHKPLPKFVFKVYGNQVTLCIPTEYHQLRPLSYADLREEQRHLKKLGFDFYLEERDEIR